MLSERLHGQMEAWRSGAMPQHYSQALGFLLRCIMPTVLRLDGLRVVIYPADHRPAHVHVIGAKGEAVFVLNCPDGPPSLRESYGFSRREELRIQKDLAAHLSTLCPQWSAIHGDF